MWWHGYMAAWLQDGMATWPHARLVTWWHICMIMWSLVQWLHDHVMDGHMVESSHGEIVSWPHDDIATETHGG